MLRAFVLLIGAAMIAAGAVRFATVPRAWPAGVELVCVGALFAAGILFERRYRKRLDTTHGVWQTTGERFVDPSSGKRVEVRYNPQTGERDYREL